MKYPNLDVYSIAIPYFMGALGACVVAYKAKSLKGRAIAVAVAMGTLALGVLQIA